jgi:3-hydroxybutyryl-CoA dehydrogenase
MIKTICVAGAGTMGSGIALAAALANYQVILFDSNEKVLANAGQLIGSNLATLVAKQKLREEEKEQVIGRIRYTADVTDCVADLVIEAIIEKMEAKVGLFTSLAAINGPETILASNTSSLSINTLQQQVPHPERVAGLHFFNPAQIMKLVEVVKGKETAPEVISILTELCTRMKKTPVLCIDAPGFIVNRVARHYYLEAMRMVEQGIADIESVDAIMEASGFKMGPFKLMDLIGMDINLAVSQSLYDAFDHPARFKPSELQIQKVKSGDLGKKTGKGFYVYTAG